MMWILTCLFCSSLTWAVTRLRGELRRADDAKRHERELLAHGDEMYASGYQAGESDATSRLHCQVWRGADEQRNRRARPHEIETLRG
ncbi:MAG: hypothetical protein GVY18_04565 [Bacteroidetes bacterium]|jgi:hypothetical protein|nr:hypothetical protein [Bacteroidota bacterium]